MPACLETLCNDGVNAARFQPKGLFNGGCRRENFRAVSLYALNQCGRGQSKMETHHGGFEFAEQIGSFRAKRVFAPVRSESMSASIPNSL